MAKAKTAKAKAEQEIEALRRISALASEQEATAGEIRAASAEWREIVAKNKAAFLAEIEGGTPVGFTPEQALFSAKTKLDAVLVAWQSWQEAQHGRADAIATLIQRRRSAGKALSEAIAHARQLELDLHVEEESAAEAVG